MNTMSTEPKAGTHGFYGSCAPLNDGARSRYTTFSVSVFEWLPKHRGGVKKGTAKVRVQGLTANPQPCYDLAAKIAAELDAGTYSGPRRIFAK
jgi:hypothetical protein